MTSAAAQPAGGAGARHAEGHGYGLYAYSSRASLDAAAQHQGGIAMRDIRASVEVQALIGGEQLRELREHGFLQHECWQCAKTGWTTEPTSVIVLAHRVFRVVKLAQAGCADSQVIEVDAAELRAVASQTAAPHGRQPRGSGSPAEPRTTQQRGRLA